MIGKKGQAFPNDKYGTKYDKNPPVGKYNVDAAEALVRPKSPAVQIKEPLRLYQKPMSIRPDALSVSKMKKFGDSVHMKVDMGSKYETKITKYPTPRGIDYEKMTDVTRPRKGVGAGFSAAQTVAPN